jgi:hypothetical protein
MQYTYKRNTEARSRNYCCIGKAVIIAYSKSVSVALVIQHAMRIRHIVICGPSGTAVFFHFISKNDTMFEKKVTERKIYILIIRIIFVRNISHSNKN